MKRNFFLIAGTAALALLAAGPTWAQATSPWIHVRVEEPRNESHVAVNLPLSVVQAALALVPQRIVSEGRIHLQGHGHDLSVADMRRMWSELRTTGDGEWVTVQDKDENVSVARKGDRLQVRVENPSHKETVHVEVPVAVVDALFSAEGSDLNLKDALAELQKLRGDVVRVEDADSNVRIWIDERN